MKLRELKEKLLNNVFTASVITFIIVMLKLGITIGIFYGFYLLGWKGLIGFTAGMAVMCIVLLTRNPIAFLFIKLFKGEYSLWDHLKGEKGDDNDGNSKKEDYIEVKRE